MRVARAGRIIRDDSLSPDQWATFARGSNDIARAVRDETGLRTVFHPHCAGFVETPWEVDELMARTDPALVGLCIDTGHLSFAGGDPIEIYRRYAARVWHVHFKDFEPNVLTRARGASWDYFETMRHGVFCELGRGQRGLPRDAPRAARERRTTDWIVVEQDVLPGMGAPAESARRNREYLRSLGL